MPKLLFGNHAHSGYNARRQVCLFLIRKRHTYDNG